MTESHRPRVLLVTRNLPPLVGGMERLNWHMAEELTKVAEVRVVGPEGAAALAPSGVTVREVPLKPLWKFLIRARALARREARTWEPSVVLAGSGLTAPIARSAARTCAARVAVYVHGLDIAVRHPVYRALWLPAIRRMDRVIANSHATATLCRGIGIDPARIGIVHPGVDLPDAIEPLSLRERGRGEGTNRGATNFDDPTQSSPRPPLSNSLASSFRTPRSGDPESSSSPLAVMDAAAFRARHNLAGRPILLSVGRLSARKGLREFVAQCLPRIVAARPDAVLLIVGEAPTNALHAEAQTPASIQAAADAAGVGSNMKFLGVITDYDELGAIYRVADVHVFPVREVPGDPEGFGMVAVEAAAHGLPTVAFATGGVVDAVAEGQSGHLVPPGNYAAFADTVLRTLATRDALRTGCVVFARQFAWPEFGLRVFDVLRH